MFIKGREEREELSQTRGFTKRSCQRCHLTLVLKEVNELARHRVVEGLSGREEPEQRHKGGNQCFIFYARKDKPRSEGRGWTDMKLERSLGSDDGTWYLA